MSPTKRQPRAEQIAAAEVEKQISDLDDQVLACRDMRHARSSEASYQLVKVEGGVRGARYLERRVVCMRCPVYWIELFRIHANWLERISSRPVYPRKGYLLHDIPKGTDVLGMVRFEQFQRAVGGLE